MTELNNLPEPDSENEPFPVEPRYHPIHKVPRKIYDFLASARLAMFLLVLLLICCVSGVTIYRQQAGNVIFNSLWFNAIMVLLVVNVACCFFGRIWGRRVTVVSFGMILFHLSFVMVFLGIVFNSLFYFRGTIRMTEGEVLPSGDPKSYDSVDMGRYFSFSRLKGDVSLIKMHTGYKVSGEDKRAAYEVSVGEEGSKSRGIIYITHKLTHGGIDYFNDKEGYSLLVVLSNRQGKDLYGAYLPLQSIPQDNRGYLYSTGYKEGSTIKPDVIQYPQPPEKPLFALQVAYFPSKLQERGGEAKFLTYALDAHGMPESRPLAEGKAVIGAPFPVGEYLLNAREVRYWVGMSVRYEPGKPIVLASLWAGLAGMIITMFGRMMRRRVRPV
jgi:cytochrome c biogenesis protein ResB